MQKYVRSLELKLNDLTFNYMKVVQEMSKLDEEIQALKRKNCICMDVADINLDDLLVESPVVDPTATLVVTPPTTTPPTVTMAALSENTITLTLHQKDSWGQVFSPIDNKTNPMDCDEIDEILRNLVEVTPGEWLVQM